MNFEEFWKRQQYTDDADDKEFAREAWELATDLEREACAVIANDYATCGALDGTAQATAEAIEKTIMQRSNALAQGREPLCGEASPAP